MTIGTILHLQRLSTEDGPGIRTTVFLKGCPLHCAWCHNPESIGAALQTQWFAVRCLHCQTCVAACPNGCLKMVNDQLVFDRTRCEACGKCTAACPSGALEALGRSVSVEEMTAELLKDRAYYASSGGGVTLSGGEPTYQPAFAAALLQALKAEDISTAIDTCGLCSLRTLDMILPYTDLVLYDLKMIDPEQHQKFTGTSNQRILENLLYIADHVRQGRKGLWVRTPVIPDATASPANITAIGEWIAAHLDGAITRWELCAFNNLCRDQYLRLGMNWAYADTPLLSGEELAGIERCAKASGVDPALVLATGATCQPE